MAALLPQSLYKKQEEQQKRLKEGKHAHAGHVAAATAVHEKPGVERSKAAQEMADEMTSDESADGGGCLRRRSSGFAQRNSALRAMRAET